MSERDGSTPGAPVGWYDAFLAECRQIDPLFRAPDGHDDAQVRLQQLNARALDDERSALCLSGGGIRSASFAVGVLQGLARRGLLQGFDYLSTVSGGGFAGSWVSAWLHRARTDPDARAALAQMEDGRDRPGEVEPWPLVRLRRQTRYMSPQPGFFSADFWTLIATMLRNLLLNWLVLIPLLAAAALLPRFQLALIHILEQEPSSAVSTLRSPDVWALAIAAVAFAAALVHVIRNLPGYGNRGASERAFVLQCLVPLSVAVLALTCYWAVWTQRAVEERTFVVAASLLNAAVWAAVGLVAGMRPFRPRTWVAALVAGGMSALIFWSAFSMLFDHHSLGPMYVTAAFPLVMGTLLLQTVVFVGLAGRDMTGADLEWWSRAGAWMLIVAVVWLGASAVVFGAPALVAALEADWPYLVHHTAALTALLGGLTSWQIRSSADGRPSRVRQAALAFTAPAFVLLVFATIATLNAAAISRLAQAGDESRFFAPFQAWPVCASAEHAAAYAIHRCHPADLGFAETLALFLLLAGVAAVVSRFVPVNKFSLHGMYLHRVTRAYLGASRHERRPNAFTGFDREDDLELWHLQRQRPLHVINATLNARTAPRTGELAREAQSFTFSPLHAGSVRLGYRPADAYGGTPPQHQAITLGTAVTISGAAASPQMGDFTTPSLAFLLTLLNARLGVWLGNPGPSGEDTWRSSEPKAGTAPILNEMLGTVTGSNPYVYLSDGGHFDNLGLWEMALRRCRRIVLVDAGCDPDYRFDDLAVAVRKCRIDHGARIEFDTGAMERLRNTPRLAHVVTGTIRYADRPEAPGRIVYIKAALTGDEPVDVVNYGRAHPDFPHESTANQWFTEAQFESYRALGLHSVEQAFADTSEGGLAAMAEQILRTRIGRDAASPLES
jgi:hypothetical protein